MAKSVKDVQKSVLFAKENKLHVTVHSSGHDFNGRSTADGSLMIDLSSMKEIEIKLNSTRHHAGELHNVNRVVVGGSSHTVSPGGYTLGGGHSPIARKFGLAVDQVLEMKVVVADGSIVDCTADSSTIYYPDGTVDSTNDTDLFWALRGGGGGTYGIVVKFTYKLHHQPRQLVKMEITIPMNNLNSPLLKGIEFMDGVNRLIQNLPDEYGGYLLLNNFPSETPAKYMIGSYTLLLLKFGPWDSETKNILGPFEECISQHECELKIENKTSFYDYEKEVFESTIYRVYILGTFLQPESLNSVLTAFMIPELYLLRQKNKVYMACGGVLIGGKISRFSYESAPIHPGFRNGLVCMTCVVAMFDPSKDEENIAAGKKFARHLQMHGNGVYLNEAAYDLDNWQDAFWGIHYHRLLKIKEKWDPTNFFTCYHCVGSEKGTTRKQIVTCD
ncbi:hypothetical protein CHS0354_015112 [Potamilus streckersoni]|uniref:FAD-binding PCMH-type domain-containing protein n=1 Tax=Potamilus streckersoni TaxID=2493646 RepID=A0AAE0W0G1_9BIVA|nr:hypothetical protein CHS0354_015112 [Potamilus streckersoni]